MFLQTIFTHLRRTIIYSKVKIAGISSLNVENIPKVNNFPKLLYMLICK